MILAVYNNESIITYGVNMDEVTYNLSMIGAYNNADNINKDITFYDAKKLVTRAENKGVTIDILE